MRAKVSRGRVRNGPPEAVSTSRRTSVGAPAVQALVQRAVLAVDGQQPAPPRARDCATISSPAITSVSLLASATSLPASSAR